MSVVGERIKEFRLRRSLSVSELARRVGVSVSTLREWENGRAIQGEPYSRLAQALDVHILELLEGSSPQGVYRELLEIEKLLQAAKMKC